MSNVATLLSNPGQLKNPEPLAARIRACSDFDFADVLPSEVIDKTKLCLLDLIGCALRLFRCLDTHQAVRDFCGDGQSGGK